MTTSTHKIKLLDFVDRQIAVQEKKILDGHIGGETAEQRAINYSAKVSLRKDLIRFKDAIAEILDSDPDDDKLPVMEEER